MTQQAPEPSFLAYKLASGFMITVGNQHHAFETPESAGQFVRNLLANGTPTYANGISAPAVAPISDDFDPSNPGDGSEVLPMANPGEREAQHINLQKLINHRVAGTIGDEEFMDKCRQFCWMFEPFECLDALDARFIDEPAPWTPDSGLPPPHPAMAGVEVRSATLPDGMIEGVQESPEEWDEVDFDLMADLDDAIEQGVMAPPRRVRAQGRTRPASDPQGILTVESPEGPIEGAQARTMSRTDLRAKHMAGLVDYGPGDVNQMIQDYVIDESTGGMAPDGR